MKVISIIQPWATLIMLGEKRFETRSCEPSKKHRGITGIHASKKVDKRICEQEPFKSVLAKHGYTAANLPTGVILATANLTECWKWREYDEVLLRVKPVIEYEVIGRAKNHFVINEQEKSFGHYAEGRFAWELADVKQIEPIPAKGQLGLWNWEGVNTNESKY